jgi:hypothetical protein
MPQSGIFSPTIFSINPNNDPCDSDVAPSYIADGLVCNAVCVEDGSLDTDDACCHNDNCTSGDCTGEVCVAGFDPEGSVSGYAFCSTGSYTPGSVPNNGTAFDNPYNIFISQQYTDSCTTAGVDEYPGAVAYYLYTFGGDNVIPTSNNPADWTSWTYSDNLTSAGTFQLINCGCGWGSADYTTFFVVAKSTNDEYTNPVGVRITVWPDC